MTKPLYRVTVPSRGSTPGHTVECDDWAAVVVAWRLLTMEEREAGRIVNLRNGGWVGRPHLTD